MIGEIENLLIALSAAGVRYLVVGGVAVVLHGHVRATADLDLVVDLDPLNIKRALELFKERGFHPRPPVALEAFADTAERQRWIDDKNLKVFSLWHPLNHNLEVDIFVEEPFAFDEAYQRALRLQIGQSVVTVASIDDLIALKRLAGRSQDIADIEALLELKNATGDEVRDAPFDGSFEGTRRRQMRSARTLPPGERLRSMERLVSELRSLRGRAS